MQKLSNSLIQKAILKKETRCRNSEINFLIYASQFQNDAGLVRDLFYKSACIALGFSFRTFYNVLYSLEKKGFISINWSNESKKHRTHWSFRILDNSFLDYKDCTKGYIKTNYFFFHELRFMRLNIKVKYLFLLLMIHQRTDKFHKISVDALKSWINERDTEAFDKYLKELEHYFVINRTDNMLFIKLRRYNHIFMDQDEFKYFSNRFKFLLSTHRICYTQRNFINFFWLLKKYKDKFYTKVVREVFKVANITKSLEPHLIKLNLNLV